MQSLDASQVSFEGSFQFLYTKKIQGNYIRIFGQYLGLYQDPPCTLNWGYMVPNSGYLGPNRG